MFHLCGQLQQNVMMDFFKDATPDVSCSEFQHWTSIVLRSKAIIGLLCAIILEQNPTILSTHDIICIRED